MTRIRAEQLPVNLFEAAKKVPQSRATDAITSYWAEVKIRPYAAAMHIFKLASAEPNKHWLDEEFHETYTSRIDRMGGVRAKLTAQAFRSGRLLLAKLGVLRETGKRRTTNGYLGREWKWTGLKVTDDGKVERPRLTPT